MMCEQGEGSLVPLVTWRVRYLRSLQKAVLLGNERTAPTAQSKKRKIDRKLVAQSTHPARSSKRGGKTSAAKPGCATSKWRFGDLVFFWQ